MSRGKTGGERRPGGARGQNNANNAQPQAGDTTSAYDRREQWRLFMQRLEAASRPPEKRVVSAAEKMKDLLRAHKGEGVYQQAWKDQVRDRYSRDYADDMTSMRSMLENGQPIDPLVDRVNSTMRRRAFLSMPWYQKALYINHKFNSLVSRGMLVVSKNPKWQKYWGEQARDHGMALAKYNSQMDQNGGQMTKEWLEFLHSGLRQQVAEEKLTEALTALEGDGETPGELSEEQIRTLFAMGDPLLIQKIAEQKNIPADILAQLLSLNDKSINQRLANNPHLDPAAWAKLAESDDPEIRMFLANNPAMDPAILAKLARDEDDTVRFLVASNPQTSEDSLLRLAKDETNEEILMALIQRDTNNEKLNALLAQSDSDVVKQQLALNGKLKGQALDILASDADPTIRMHLAANSHLDPEVLHMLSADEHPAVRVQLATNMKAGQSDELLARLAADEVSEVRQAVASNPDLLITLAADLARDPEINVIKQLAKNPALGDSEIALLSVHPDEEVRNNLTEMVQARYDYASLNEDEKERWQAQIWSRYVRNGQAAAARENTQATEHVRQAAAAEAMEHLTAQEEALEAANVQASPEVQEYAEVAATAEAVAPESIVQPNDYQTGDDIEAELEAALSAAGISEPVQTEKEPDQAPAQVHQSNSNENSPELEEDMRKQLEEMLQNAHNAQQTRQSTQQEIIANSQAKLPAVDEMGEDKHWDEFLYWADQFNQWEEKDEEGNTYNVFELNGPVEAYENAATINKIAHKVMAGDPDWPKAMRKALNEEHTTVNSYVIGPWTKWCNADQEGSRAALAELWTNEEGTLGERIERFVDQLPEDSTIAKVSRGEKIMLGSVLLAGAYGSEVPVYQSSQGNKAYSMLGYPPPPKDLGIAETYDYYVRFQDHMLEQAKKRDLPFDSRSEIQGVLSWVTKGPTWFNSYYDGGPQEWQQDGRLKKFINWNDKRIKDGKADQKAKKEAQKKAGKASKTGTAKKAEAKTAPAAKVAPSETKPAPKPAPAAKVAPSETKPAPTASTANTDKLSPGQAEPEAKVVKNPPQTEAPAAKKAPAKKATADKKAPADKKATADKKAPAKKATADKKAPADKKATAAKKAPAVKKATAAKKAPAVKKATADKKAPAAKKAPADKKATAAKKAPADKKATAAKKAPSASPEKVEQFMEAILKKYKANEIGFEAAVQFCERAGIAEPKKELSRRLYGI